jgi:hypothetical protein
MDARVTEWLAVQPGMASVRGDVRQPGDMTRGGQGTDGGKAECVSMSLRLGINSMVRQQRFRGGRGAASRRIQTGCESQQIQREPNN